MSVELLIETEPAQPEDVQLDVRLHETAPGELTVQLIGELDLASAELVTAVLRCRNNPNVVRLDLADLTFIDCAGLHAIETLRDRLIARAGRLELIHVGHRVGRLLGILGFVAGG